MDALGNFKFIFWVATPDLLCAQPELDQTQTLCWRNSLSGGTPFLCRRSTAPGRRGYPGSQGWRALRPQVWRSDVQFSWKHLLCPDGKFLGDEGWGKKEVGH